MDKSQMISVLRRMKGDELETCFEKQDQQLFRLDSLWLSAAVAAPFLVNDMANGVVPPDGSPAANALEPGPYYMVGSQSSKAAEGRLAEQRSWAAR